MGFLREIMLKLRTLPINLVEGHLTILEGLSLKELASQVEDFGVIVEIGSYKGRSTCFLGSGKKSTVKIFAIDSWDSQDMSNNEGDTKNTFLENTKGIQNLTPIRGNSNDVKVISEIPQLVDLIFIDANHNYDFVKQDISIYLPKLKPGKLIAFHDYGNPCGVKQAVEESLLRNELEIIQRIDSMLICKKVSS